jgi:hypothetical protein
MTVLNLPVLYIVSLLLRVQSDDCFKLPVPRIVSLVLRVQFDDCFKPSSAVHCVTPAACSD